jgi:hypothetical protein
MVNLCFMKSSFVFLLGFILVLAVVSPTHAQRDASTSSARAAYGMGGYGAPKKSVKKKKNKKVKTPKKARKNNTDAARTRRRSLTF